MGCKLKVEEFPDLVAILEYEFEEGDQRERGGGGLESHSKLRKKLLYTASDSKTRMKDAKEAILALAPEDFTISLSTCFNHAKKSSIFTGHHRTLIMSWIKPLKNKTSTASIRERPNK